MKKYKPATSIVTCIYNSSKFLEDCILSIVKQKFKDWEIIFVDDKSKDNSLQILNKLVKKYDIENKCKILKHKKNFGYGKTLKDAIDNSQGDLITIIDSDDALARDDALSICVKVHDQHPEISMSYSNYIICDRNLKQEKNIRSSTIKPGQGLLTKEKYYGNSLKISHLKVFKKSMYDITEGLDSSLLKSVDKDLVLKLEEIAPFYHIKKFLYLYRKNPDGISKKFKDMPEDYKIKVHESKIQMINNARKRRLYNMKIYIGNNNHVLIRRLVKPFGKEGHTFLRTNPKECDAQLAFIRLDKRIKLPSILRLDGIYYDEKTDYEKRNSGISTAHSQANGIIYQSNYSKKLCEKFLSTRKKNCKTSVIYNGIEKFWAGQPKKHKGFHIIVLAKWRRHKRLKETIEIFQEFLTLCPNSKLHILGKLHKNKIINHPNIKYYGMIQHKEMFEILRKADASISISKRDSCPNSVVEMIGQGIPVITTSACGGAHEMCSLSNGCFSILEKEDNEFDSCKPYTDDWNIISGITKQEIINTLLKIKEEKIRCDLPEILNIDYTAKEYVKLIKKVLNK